MSNLRKNNARKVMTTSAAAALAATAIAPAVASADSHDFSDVPNDHAYADQINALAEEGIVQGDENGNFNPEDGMSRASAAEMLAKALDLQPEGENTFSDVPDDHWAVDSITALYEAGVVQGDEDGDFNPSDELSRAAIAEMVVKAYGLELDETNEVTFDDVDEGAWYANNVHILASHGLVQGNGEGQYSPENDMQRQHFAKLVYDAEVAYGDLDDGEEPGENPVSVDNVSEINNTEFTLTVAFSNDVSQSDLEGETLSLTHGDTEVSVTADFQELSDNVATFAIDENAQADLVGGAYDVEGSFADFAGQTTHYDEVVSGNYVEGFVFDGEEAVEGAEVEVDGNQVVTNDRGYYKIATNAGSRTVTISKGTTYFEEEVTSVPVKRNYSTVVNAEMQAVDPDQLAIEGTVFDQDNASAVSEASVKLQERNSDGDWEDVEALQTAVTDEDGKYSFKNSAAGVNEDPTDNLVANGTNYLSIGTEYRVVVEKEISEDNLDDVYSEEVDTFTLSNKQPETTIVNEVSAVDEVESFSVDFSWTDEATIPDSVSFDFLNTNGSELLEDVDLNSDDFEVDGNAFKESVELVEAEKFENGDSGEATTPRLVSGTYFLRINDSEDNATTIVPVEVTEGGDVEASAEIDRAYDYQLSTSVEQVEFGGSLLQSTTDLETILNAEPSEDTFLGESGDEVLTTIADDYTRNSGEGNNVSVSYDVYQTVAGVDVPVYGEGSKPSAANVMVNSNGATEYGEFSIQTSETGLPTLGDNTYKVLPSSAYVAGLESETEITPGGDFSSKNLGAQSTASVNDVSFEDEDGNTVNPDNVTNIKLLDEDDNVVAETGSYNTSDNTDKSIFYDEYGNRVTDQFSNIEPGDYKLEVEVDSNQYKSAETDLQTIVDFQNFEFNVELEEYANPIVSGYVLFDDYTNVMDDDAGSVEASIAVYDSNGNYVTGQDLSDGDNYEFNSDLTAGNTYTFVVRGEGFETMTKELAVTNGQNTPLNFLVEEGSEGRLQHNIVGEDNYKLDFVDGGSELQVRDQYYAPVADDTLEFTGETPALKDKSDKTFVFNDLSRGSYTLAVQHIDQTKYETNTDENGDYTTTYLDTVSVNDVNSTTYGTIYVPLQDQDEGTLTTDINVSVIGDEVVPNDAGEVDYIEVVDANTEQTVEIDSEIVDRENSDATEYDTSFTVPTDHEYTVNVYFTNGYKASEDVTVQEFSEDVTIHVDKAVR